MNSLVMALVFYANSLAQRFALLLSQLQAAPKISEPAFFSEINAPY